MKEKRKDLTPAYGHIARLLRSFPDFDPSFIRPVRQKAVELLDLKEGDRVLDVGWGLGPLDPIGRSAPLHDNSRFESAGFTIRREEAHDFVQRNLTID